MQDPFVRLMHRNLRRSFPSSISLEGTSMYQGHAFTASARSRLGICLGMRGNRPRQKATSTGYHLLLCTIRNSGLCARFDHRPGWIAEVEMHHRTSWHWIVVTLTAMERSRY